MTSQTQTGEGNDSLMCDEKTVEEFLKIHPTFFTERPELLKEMIIPHNSGTAISLIEKQVSLLREENRTTKQRIDELVDIARENEQLITKLHRMSVALIETQTLDDLVEVLSEQILNEFSAQCVSVKVFQEYLNEFYNRKEVVSRKDDALAGFESILKSKKPVCGQFNSQQLTFLFEERAPSVKSMALVPLIGMDTVGILAIASSDADHFKAGMSTSFLSSMSDIASSVLKRFLQV